MWLVTALLGSTVLEYSWQMFVEVGTVAECFICIILVLTAPSEVSKVIILSFLQMKKLSLHDTECLRQDHILQVSRRV